jgi:hypothetical protein
MMECARCENEATIYFYEGSKEWHMEHLKSWMECRVDLSRSPAFCIKCAKRFAMMEKMEGKGVCELCSQELSEMEEECQDEMH